jgi:hypothetical protein
MSNMEKNAIGPLTAAAGLGAFGIALKSDKILPMIGRVSRDALGKVYEQFAPKKNILQTAGGAIKKLTQGRDLNDSERFLLRAGLVGAGIAGYAGTQAAVQYAQTPAHNRVFASIIDSPDIPESEYGKAANIYGLITKYAPSIGKDAKVSHDLVSQMIRYDEVPAEFVQKLMEMEKKHKENRPGMLEVLPVVGKAISGL